MHMRIAIAAAIGSIVTFSLMEMGPERVGGAPAMQGRKPPSGEIATFTKLPSLGSNAEAHGVNEAGTVVVGHSFDRGGLRYAVTWTLRNGSWVIAKLPYAGKAALAHGVSNAGDAVGYVGSSPRYPALWHPASGYTTLGCASEAVEALAISPDGLVIVGHIGARPVVWASSSDCAESLPPLVPGVAAVARAVNGDGSIIGGLAARVPQSTYWPVRWTGPAGARQIEELGTRPGYVLGANAAGDLAGQVTIACALEGGCQRTVMVCGWRLYRTRHARPAGLVTSIRSRRCGRHEHVSPRDLHRLFLVGGDWYVPACGEQAGRRERPERCAV